MASPDPLSPLRDSIAEVDRALLELLRRRMDLAAEVGRVKAAADLPVVVRDVEDRVLGRARQHAEACGVSEEVMAEVFQGIIRGSVERQYRVGISLREQRGERVLIVGGAGGMGGWFRGFLELAGHSVDLTDPTLGTLPRAPGRFAFEHVQLSTNPACFGVGGDAGGELRPNGGHVRLRQRAHHVDEVDGAARR